MNRETLIQEWIRLRAELETVERRIAGTFEKSEPVGDLFDNPTGRTRTPDLPVNTRLPLATRDLILARMKEKNVPMTAAEIAKGFRNNPRTPAQTLVYGILRGLISTGVVMRSKGPRGIAVFEIRRA